MKRRVAAAISLAGLLGTIVAWGQGSRGWGVSYVQPQKATTLFVVGGWVHLLTGPHISTVSGLQTLSKSQVRVAKRIVEWTSVRRLRCPLYVLCVVFAFWHATHLYLAIKQRTGQLPDHCSRCGYNLPGNVSGICPERGEPAGVADTNRLG